MASAHPQEVVTVATPRDEQPGVWQPIDRVPSASEPELARSEEVAPGRHDGNDGISGFCPPRADVFALGTGRELVLSEPCSGPTFVVLRDGAVNRRIENGFFGVIGRWRALPLPDDRVLLINEANPGSLLGTGLLVADLRAGRVTYVDLPRELRDPRRLDVQVAGDRIFISGGATREAIGVGGCENSPPQRGCDPYVKTVERPNHRAWAIWLPR